MVSTGHLVQHSTLFYYHVEPSVSVKRLILQWVHANNSRRERLPHTRPKAAYGLHPLVKATDKRNAVRHSLLLGNADRT